MSVERRGTYGASTPRVIAVPPGLFAAQSAMRAVMLFAIVLFAGEASAQQSPRVVLGGFVRAGTGWSGSRVSVYAGSPECGTFSSGSAREAAAGVTLELAELLGSLGLSATMSFDRSIILLSTPPPVPTRIVDERSEALVELQREYRREIVEHRVGLDLLARLDLGSGLAIALGPSLYSAILATAEQNDNVTGPGRFRFADGQSSRPMDGSHGSAASTAVFGLVLEAERRFTVGALTVSPFASVRGDLTSRLADGSLRTIQLSAGVRALFDPASHRDRSPMAVSSTESAVTERVPPLRASIAIYGIGERGTRQDAPMITVRELIEYDHLPLVPAAFFDALSESINTRYLDRNDSVAHRDPLVAIQGRLLDTIGARMRLFGEARLDLWGSSSADESPELATRRVQSVRRHLIEHWGIAPDRLLAHDGPGPLERSSEASADGRADNRRVEIVASDPAILAPIVARRTALEFDPPTIELVPAIDAPAGIAAWTVDLLHRDELVASFTSDDHSSDNPVWNVAPASADTAVGELVARLRVIDSSGASVLADARTVVRLAREVRESDRSVEFRGDRVIRHFQLIAFEFDRADPGDRNEWELERIASGIGDGATVSVTGAADRIGERLHNLELARRRAETVATALRRMVKARGISDVTIEIAVPMDETPVFANDLPEGRFLSRGAEVIVDQPR